MMIFAAFNPYRGGRQGRVRKAIMRIPKTRPVSRILVPPLKNWQPYLYRARFCPCPLGDTATTRRFFNAVLAGCGRFKFNSVPIVVSDNLTLPWDASIPGLAERSGGIDYKKFVIKLKERDVIRSPSLLVKKAQAFDLAKAQAEMKKIRRFFVYNIGENWQDGAFGKIVRTLEELTQRGVQKSN